MCIQTNESNERCHCEEANAGEAIQWTLVMDRHAASRLAMTFFYSEAHQPDCNVMAVLVTAIQAFD